MRNLGCHECNSPNKSKLIARNDSDTMRGIFVENAIYSQQETTFDQ